MSPRRDFLSFSPPALGEEEIEEVVDTLRSGWITTGPKVNAFEEAFAAELGADRALALSSGTAAMHTSLAALGVGPGDVVITTTMTFCSTVHVIEQVGARPVLVDVQSDTLNIDPELVEGAIAAEEGRVVAILPVHLYGHPCDMDALSQLAASNGMAIVEDAAHALPASYRDRTVGSTVAMQGNDRYLTCFSFYATKNLTTAEGGMVTGPADLIDEARIWSLHGMSRDAWGRYSQEGSWCYEVVRPGFKYNMTDIQASMGLRQLRKMKKFQERRREIVQIYSEGFHDVAEVEVPRPRPEVESAWHIYPLRLNLDQLSIDRGAFIREMKDRNIGTSVHFIPVHLHPYYRDKYGFGPSDFPVAFGEYQRLLSLPLHPRLTDDDARDVVDAVRDVSAKHRR